MLDTKEIGQRIKQLRKSRNMKQDDLGIILNLSRSQISNLENGRRNLNIKQIKTLADHFGVSFEFLGIKNEAVDTIELLERARVLFQNKDIPINQKQELAEEIYKIYLQVKTDFQ